jgi:acetolactate synthase-1/2/3 large subunit
MTQRLLARAAFDAASLDERTAANKADREAYEAASIVDAEPWEGPGVHPGHVVATLGRVLSPDAIIATDAGDFGTSAGAMGYGLPAAIGATIARPGRLGVVLAGDGGFAMTMAEMETAVRERAHVVALVFDSGRYGTVRGRKRERGVASGPESEPVTEPGTEPGSELGPVDFAAVAEACGALGLSVRIDEEFEPALRQALEAGRPTLIHLALDPRWTTPEAGLAAEPEAEPPAEPEADLAAEPEPNVAIEPDAAPEPAG